MKICILTLGTRGDIQPYAVLGQALKRRGHHVTLATAKNFESLILSHDIDFVSVEADFQAVMESDEGKKMLKGNPFAIKRNLNTWIYPLIKNSLLEFYTLAVKSDKVIYHVKTLADSFADQFPQKMIRASVIPVVEPTRKFPNPSFSGISLPRFLNRLSYIISNLSIKLLSKPISEFRSTVGLPKNFKVPEIKNIYGISSLFLETPSDYSSHSTYSGFWFGTSTQELSKDLLDFIQQGKPPLVLTFGSMPFKSKLDLQKTILKATQQFNIRFIVIRGWGLQDTHKLEVDPLVKVESSVPYEKLFPLVKAVIHHGGIGTTAACLRAAKPFFVCPILYPVGDQNFWGQLAYKKGLAVKPVPVKKLTEKIFLARTQELLETKHLYDNAQVISAQLKKEDGIQNTIDEIEKNSLSI